MNCKCRSNCTYSLYTRLLWRCDIGGPQLPGQVRLDFAYTLKVQTVTIWLFSSLRIQKSLLWDVLKIMKRDNEDVE